ncbi:MAG: TetR/AcrR family transcriptional regulator [Hyphomonas sp.]
MARTRNQENYDVAREKLLDTGQQLFRQKSFSETGINDVLKQAGVAKGSFYHYFDSKEEFGIAVAHRYSRAQVESARRILSDQGVPPLARLKNFFEGAKSDMADRGFAEGCLMCNLTTELADEFPAFQSELNDNWTELSAEIAACLWKADLSVIGLSHLSADEAADWLLNAWSGALTRMKAAGNDGPLNLFLKSVFKTGV